MDVLSIPMIVAEDGLNDPSYNLYLVSKQKRRLAVERRIMSLSDDIEERLEAQIARVTSPVVSCDKLPIGDGLSIESPPTTCPSSLRSIHSDSTSFSFATANVCGGTTTNSCARDGRLPTLLMRIDVIDDDKPQRRMDATHTNIERHRIALASDAHAKRPPRDPDHDLALVSTGGRKTRASDLKSIGGARRLMPYAR